MKGYKGVSVRTDKFDDIIFEYDFNRQRTCFSIIDDESREIFEKKEFTKEEFVEIMKKLKEVLDDCIQTAEE